ncbi:virulence protein, partial [Eubacteriales bacterium OttesenSCG-928-A19]|nr:virulence protein [Eubacteriales bacterium OttesenSCG-928-A19]
HADSDEDAIRQAQDFCSNEVTMLGLHQLDEDYNEVRDVEVKPDRLILQMPLDGFTPEKLDNLFRMVIAKTPLLKMALDTEELPIRQTADTLDFPWFHFTEDAETVVAYTTLISLLCKTAKEKKRVTAKEREAPNPKYALRCFLLSLGFIGEEYKAARKVLLSRMEGNGSWKHGKKVEVVDDAVSE